MPAEHTITVPRTARYYTLGPQHGFPREIWFVVHGFGQLAGRFITKFEPIDDGTRLIVAPEALSRYYLDSISERRGKDVQRVGATWMTREFREAEIEDYVTYLGLVSDEIHRHLSGAAPRVVVLGFSQGAATVSRWLARSGMRADHLVLWSGTLPPELDSEAWAATAHRARLTMVMGTEDEFAPPAMMAKEAERLAEAGIAYQLRRFDGGHTIDPQALTELAAAVQAP